MNNPIEKKQIIAGKLLLTYYRSSPSGSTDVPLVFLHGWRSDSLAWFPSVDRIIASHQCIFLDLPGFGRSQNPPNPFSVSDYSQLVAGFLDKLGIRKTIVVGHSFGGRIGIKLAVEYPRLVTSLVLVDSAGIRHEAKHKILTLLAKTVKPLLVFPVFRDLRKTFYRKIGSEDYLATPELTETYKRVIGEDLTADLARIQQQTLLVWGEVDHDTPVSDARLMETIIPNVSLAVIPRAGHFSFLDDPIRFQETLTSFVNKAEKHKGFV